MAIIQNPLIGRARQKMGGAVFTSWKGINVLKGRPLSVANPRSDSQIMRRSALIQIVAIGRLTAAAINFGFREQAVQKSSFNAFTGYNLRNAFDYSMAPTATLIPEAMLFSQGTVASTAMLTASAVSGLRTFSATFATAITGAGQSASDLAKVVLYNVTNNEFVALSTIGTRSTGTVSGSTPENFLNLGNEVIAYVFFYNVASRKSSDSLQISVVAAA